MNYKLKDDGVIRLDDDLNIPDAPGNRDWRKYQEWLAEGNTPEPADPELPPGPEPTAELDAALTKVFADVDSGPDTVAGMKAGFAALGKALLGTAGKAGRISARRV